MEDFKFTLGDAASSLLPNAIYTLRGVEYSGLEWLDSRPKPTEVELKAEQSKLQAEYASKLYQRQRAAEYPDYGDQLDYIYHNGIDKWKTDIVDPVKAKYPKPS